MKQPQPASFLDWDFPPPDFQSWIQAALPDFLHTLPILLTIEGQGSVLAGHAPLAPPEEPTND